MRSSIACIAIALLVTLVVVTLLPAASADPARPHGVKTIHCTFNMSFTGQGYQRKFWGKLQVPHDYDSPGTPYQIIQAEGKSTGVETDGTTWRSPITLRNGRANNFALANPWFDDAGLDIHINNRQQEEYVVGISQNMWQLGVRAENLLYIDADWVFVWCDADDNDEWKEHEDDWEREGDDDDDEKEKQRKNENHSHAVGDPEFSGFLGQLYQVHGTVDMVHNIVSAPSMQVNALFVFLKQGSCPEYAAAKRTNCWSHPGTYFGRIGIKTSSDERLFVRSGGAKDGFALVTLNGKPINAGDSVVSEDIQVTRPDTHTLIVDTPLMKITMENSDMFINLLDVSVHDLAVLRRQRAHGLLGQTWRRRSGGQVSVLEGLVDDYVEASNDIFGDDFVYNRFSLATM